MKYKILFIFLFITILTTSCSDDYLELPLIATESEETFYQNEEDMFQALVAVYDVLQWGGTSGWTMKTGLLNTASDDCFAGGSDASDQPAWVAYDNFNLDPFLGPQVGLWEKGFDGVYRANKVLEKIEEIDNLPPVFKARTIAEAKFLRAYFYFDLVRFFGNVPLFEKTLSGNDIYGQTQNTSQEIYTLIEQDLNDAKNAFELPETVPPAETGRITKGAVIALLGKVILFQNDNARMLEAAGHFEEVINSGIYALEADFGDIFKSENEFGSESIFEINYSDNQRGGWGNFGNGTEGNYDVQFFGMRDYVGPTFSFGYGFCPVSLKLVEALTGDPRFEHTIIDGNVLKQQGGSYSTGYQNTDYFIRKYAGLQDESALDGEPALNWGNNVRDIRLADVLLMAAECYARAGDDATARGYLNQVRSRVFLQEVTASGGALLDAIYLERQLELATEGHRFFDLVRTGKAAQELDGFVTGKHEYLPVPQAEIDRTAGSIIQNPGY